MSRPDLSDLLEEGLAQLRSGAGLEEVLARHPAQADQLRPLLEAARMAQSVGANVSDLEVAQNRSRARFLGAARERRQRGPASAFGILTRMRMAGAVALITLVLFASLVGAGLSSVSAVPGQALYPVKLVVEQAQMALTTRQSSRLALEEAFDRRRMVEAEKLLHAGKIRAVTFAGFLWEDPQNGWFVDLVKLILTPEQEVMARALEGSYVEIKGVVRGAAGVEVNELQLRLFHLDGEIQKMDAGTWLVSGVTVQIQESTQVIGNLKVGMQAELTVVRLKDGQFLALSAKPGGRGSQGPGREPEDIRGPKKKKVETPQPAQGGVESSPDDDHSRLTAVFLSTAAPGDDDHDVTIDRDYFFSGAKKTPEENRTGTTEVADGDATDDDERSDETASATGGAEDGDAEKTPEPTPDDD